VGGELRRAGLTVAADGHLLMVEIADDETYDTVRDAVAALGLGLVRMEQRRHHIAELFRGEQPAGAAGPPPADAAARAALAARREA
jgi:ABC-2 type transport system ATP-binding protein